MAMSETKGQDEKGGVSVRALEIGVAAAIVVLSAVVMYDSWRIGAGWGSDGPQAGYFPFYIGVAMLVSSGIILFKAITQRSPREVFVDPHKFRPVLTLLVPSIVYVALAAFLGVYVSAALYLAFFMAVIGRYRAAVVVPIAIGVPIALFLLFEVWFLVPLPKGPLEDWLGF
jgi:hypothetical protein